MGFLAFWLGLIAILFILACVMLATHPVLYTTGVA